MSDTPRTDEAKWGTDRVTVDFARQLERELAAMTKYAERLEEIGDCLYENSEPTRYCLDACKDRKLKEMEQWKKAKETKP